jgi:hypothetical protein
LPRRGQRGSLAVALVHAGEQQRGFGRRNAFDQADLVQRLAESGQRVGADLCHKVPATIGCMDLLHFGKAAQRADHPCGFFALNGDAHHRPHLAQFRFRRRPYREPPDGAAGEQPRDAVLNRAARNFELLGQAGGWLARIGAQQCQQSPVNFVHHIAIETWHNAKSLTYSSSLRTFR